MEIFFYRDSAQRNKSLIYPEEGGWVDVVQNTINELHGNMQVETTPDQGTSFILRFPLAQDTA
ncbi:MAG: hypothetical protein HQM11_14525 [SAR324 cluster bacterium]|nr:hypothetical protein [SAR324 cluster bacterium]